MFFSALKIEDSLILSAIGKKLVIIGDSDCGKNMPYVFVRI